ncbi:MAG: hypothetical protein KJ065_12600 [Anaerolineae bacterium]|nr:hypothetical protein [Anaerolineae bacterium]
MYVTKHWITLLMAAALLLCLAGTAAAQSATGTLMVGQPAIVQITAAGEAVRYEYTLEQASSVTLQVLSDAAQPTIAILHDGEIITEQPNAEAQTVVNVTEVLAAGTYTVEIGTLHGTPATVIVLVSELPITVNALTAGSAVTSAVSSAAPVALFSFAALTEPAYLYIDSGLPSMGVEARLLDTSTGRVSATLAVDVLGARLHIPASSVAYRLEIAHSGSNVAESFTVCLVAASVEDCQSGATDAQPTITPVATVMSETTADCTVSPNSASGANLRQTASVNAPIIIAIPAGASALVSGISPDGTFYNVVYGVWSGWVATVAVTPSASCGSLAVIAPPPLPPAPTPVPPTAAPPQPPPPPTQVLGPCHVYFTADERIYTRPEIDSAYIYDQVSAGGEIIPAARWNADPSWWKTSYGGWWLNALGTAGEVRGDCSNLPLVAWP